MSFARLLFAPGALGTSDVLAVRDGQLLFRHVVAGGQDGRGGQTRSGEEVLAHVQGTVVSGFSFLFLRPSHNTVVFKIFLLFTV